MYTHWQKMTNTNGIHGNMRLSTGSEIEHLLLTS